jgi:hypothetical protein
LSGGKTYCVVVRQRSTVADMRSLLENNGSLPAGNGERRLRLRCEVVDALMPDMSQAEQARRFNISPAHYSRMRRGQRGAGGVIALHMAQVAGTSVDALFGRAA